MARCTPRACCERHGLEPAVGAAAAATTEMLGNVQRWQSQGHLVCCSRTALPSGAALPALR